MPLIIKDIGIVPPEDWRFYVEQTNTTISTKNYLVLYPMIVQHCQSNNVTVPSQQDVIDQMCKELRIACYDGMSPLVNKWYLNIPMPPSTGCCGR